MHVCVCFYTYMHIYVFFHPLPEVLLPACELGSAGMLMSDFLMWFLMELGCGPQLGSLERIANETEGKLKKWEEKAWGQGKDGHGAAKSESCRGGTVVPWS